MVLAGDVCPAYHPLLPEILKLVRKHFPKIIYIPGNHEYYQVRDAQGRVSADRQDVESQWKKLKEVCEKEDVTLIDCGSVELSSDTVLLGCTLWYKVDKSLQKKQIINDVFEICEQKGAKSFDHEKRFEENLEWLSNELAKVKGNGKRAVVITHHLPLGKLLFDFINRKPISYPYQFSESAGFTTDLSDVIRDNYSVIDAWCFGHTHSRLEFRDPLSGCRFYANPYGYPFENNHIK
jgi:hypothetical protein